jgi:alpha-tubulin suppressor-like RCC1 family protein
MRALAALGLSVTVLGCTLVLGPEKVGAVDGGSDGGADGGATCPATCAPTALCDDWNTLRATAQTPGAACPCSVTLSVCPRGCSNGACRLAPRLVAGGTFTCLRNLSGGAKCWGYNYYGQLGDGTSTTRESAVTVLGLSGAVELTLGDDHSCARFADGGVSCWGSNDRGQLGDGSNTGRTAPVTHVALDGAAITIAAGYIHTCAVLTDGTVECWGGNTDGELGVGSHTDQWTPKRVPNLNGVAAVAAGERHTCARLLDGTIQCWGFDYWGQLGDGNFDAGETLPVQVLDVISAVDLVAGGGSDHTCVRQANGQVQCWGANLAGQLGDGTRISQSRPELIVLAGGATALAVGGLHTCLQRDLGEVDCWGGGGSGQLGDGSTDAKEAPTEIPGFQNAIEVAAGALHTCALMPGEQVLCTGDNHVGELGDGTNMSRNVPAPVLGL